MTKQRCKILFLIPTLTGGGAERVVVTLLRHLDRSRFDPALGVVDMRNAAFRDDVPDDVTFTDLDCSRVRYALPRIIRLVRRTRPDAVFSTLGHLNLAIAVARPLFPSETRFIGREANVIREDIGHYQAPRFWTWLYRRFYARLDHSICQSHYLRDDLLGFVDLPEHQVTVINNPVDIDMVMARSSDVARSPVCYPEVPDRINLVAAGRLVPQKGFDLLIEAAALCEDPRIHFWILGEGPLENELRHLAESHSVADRIHFLGFKDNPYPFFTQADAFILSSRYEGFPNVVLEALTCGTPVIAMPAPGGTTEILKSIRGCEMAGDVSAPALAGAIMCWLDEKYPVRIPVDVTAQYAAEHITRQYEDTFLGVVRSAGSAPEMGTGLKPGSQT